VYQGIDDIQWPIEADEVGLRKFTDGLEVPKALEGVQVARNWEKTYQYWMRCCSRGVMARLLLISTRYVYPCVTPSPECWRMLGYDVAEPMGQHSVLRHEVITGTAPQLQAWRLRLNPAGLFDSLGTAEEFLADRHLVSQTNPRGMELSPGFQFVPVLVHHFCGEEDKEKTKLAIDS
jgi:hypothetical protein